MTGIQQDLLSVSFPTLMKPTYNDWESCILYILSRTTLKWQATRPHIKLFTRFYFLLIPYLLPFLHLPCNYIFKC